MDSQVPNRNDEVIRLVKQARFENRLAIRAMAQIKSNGLCGRSLQEVVMPRFVRNNLMAQARRLRATF